MYPYNRKKVSGKSRDRHRLVMEERLGRKLSRNEVVHHKNESKADDREDNLEVKTRSQHSRDHVTPEQRERFDRVRIEPGSTLSDGQVLEIRKALDEGCPVHELAKAFRVNRRTVQHIKDRTRFQRLLC